VLDAVGEENEVHGTIVRIVEVKSLVKARNQCSDFRKLQVSLLRILKVTKHEVLVRIELPLRTVHVQIAAEARMGEIVILIPILLVDKAVPEYAEGLVDPD